MNLFELFVKIGVDDQASGKLSNLSSKLGNGLKTAAKIGTAAVGAAASGITALTTAAVNNYAEYEQLIGGVETLYGAKYKTIEEYIEGTGAAAEYAEQTFAEYQKRQQAVLDNAANAYKTAGMSANEYMNTVNGFAASLTSSLGEYEWQAASYADMIVSDMADNANKMGTNMEMIQNAYSGFAKQNYTMLDNLKLGYGGTKTEMERLLRDAERMAGYIEGSLDIESFADIADAIHIVQEEMGITGTTALEAGRTISGSVGAMKSAWANLLTGLADGNANVGELVNNLVTTIVGDGTESNLGVLGNVMPAVKTALSGASKLVSELLPKIVQEIPSIINDNLPILAEAAISIIQSLVDGISENQEMLMTTAFETITYLAESLISMLPQIVALGLDLIVSLANGIAESLPELIPTIVDVVLQIVETLIDNVDQLIDASIEIITALAEGLINALPTLIEKAPEIVEKLVDAVIENVPKLLDAAFEIITKLASGLVENFPEIVAKGKEIVEKIISGISEVFSDLTQKGKDIIEEVKSGIKKKIDDAKQWGKDLIQNFLDGITAKWQALKDKVSSVAQTVKNFLGFSEPKEGPLSNFHTYAPDMMDLFAKGIRDNENVITDQIEKSFDFGERTIKFGAEYGDGFGVKKATGNAFGGTSIGNITINIDGAKYSDEQSLASAIALEIQNMTDRRAAVYA